MLIDRASRRTSGLGNRFQGASELLEKMRNTALRLGKLAHWLLPVVARLYPELPAYSTTASTTVFGRVSL